jgi:hypothetical protein
MMLELIARFCYEEGEQFSALLSDVQWNSVHPWWSPWLTDRREIDKMALCFGWYVRSAVH